jgi:Kef-type K+ transport system membrane component KefB
MHLEQMKRDVDPAVLHYDLILLGQIALLFGASALGGIVTTWMYLPPTLGYLVGGAFVGPSGLGLVNHFKEVETISLFGTVFLLFAHGADYSMHHFLWGIKAPRDQHSRSSIFSSSSRVFVVSGIVYVASTTMIVALATVALGWVNIDMSV